MKYYIYGKKSKVYSHFTLNKELAQEFLIMMKREYPEDEWVMIEEA